MGKFIDILGQRFGKLLVVGQFGVNKDNRVIWNCLCDCGITVQRTAKAIKKAKELYCGDEHPTKICTKCGKDKPKTEYHKYNTALNRINPKCKECVAQFYQENISQIKKYYNDNKQSRKEARKIISKKSRIKNWQKEKIYKTEYYKRESVKSRKSEIHLNRKKYDINYNIKRRLRWRLRDAVKRTIGKGYKYKSSLVLLGCDMEFFKSYIENKFEYGMNWERIAYIHIDHIKPCSQFDLTKLEDQKQCFHYTNLQPLWEVDNLIKGHKYIQVSK